jgi:hypothetical protein
MATTTSRAGLTKPAGTENISIAILNTNADLVDANLGFQPVTSGTRPAAPYNGQAIRETDTGLFYAHNGSTPASAGWVQVLTGAGNVSLPASASFILGADVNLYRSAANVLKTDDALIVVGQLQAQAGLVVTGNESVSGSAATAGNMTIGGTLNVTGTLSQGGKAVQLKNRIWSGQIDITPVANTPTSAALSFGTTLDGTVFRAQATYQGTAPGSLVLGVGVGVASATSVPVWVYRTNTTSTRVHVLVIGSDT